MTELYKKHRPKSLSKVIGQPSALSILKNFVANDNVPHAIMFVGPSGVGKTTIARILTENVNCLQDTNFTEINCAECDPLETIRNITKNIQYRPLGGGSRVYLLDEYQSFSRATNAQQACLKLFEDCPNYVYFFLCTTDPHKIIPTIRNRCTEIKLVPVSNKVVSDYVKAIAKKEKKPNFSADVADMIAEKCSGSVRAALVLLESVLHIDNENEQIETIKKVDSAKASENLVKLLANPKTPWKDISETIKFLEKNGEEAETVRRQILGYAKSMLLNNSPRGAIIIDNFQFDVFSSGWPGLALMAWKITKS